MSFQHTIITSFPGIFRNTVKSIDAGSFSKNGKFEIGNLGLLKP
jgi:hypothetical protein